MGNILLKVLTSSHPTPPHFPSSTRNGSSSRLKGKLNPAMILSSFCPSSSSHQDVNSEGKPDKRRQTVRGQSRQDSHSLVLQGSYRGGVPPVLPALLCARALTRDLRATQGLISLAVLRAAPISAVKE